MVQRKDISMKERIKNRVHELYWNDDINCARTAIICLSELFETAAEPQTIWSAVGLHGAGGYRAQCGMGIRAALTDRRTADKKINCEVDSWEFRL